MEIDPNLLLAKMGENGNDDKTLWLFLLLLLYGKDGFGGGGGDRCCPPVTLEQMNDMQNALSAQLTNTNQNANDHFLQASDTASRNQLANETNAMAIQQSISNSQSSNLIGQKDITAAIADCCCQNLIQQKETQGAIDSQSCETRNTINVQGLQTQNAILSQGCAITNAIEKCCCETQNAIALQTNSLQTTICNEGQLTRQLITDNRMQDLQTQLQICRDENSNLRQTEVLSQRIRDACCQPCQPCHPHHPHPWPHGGNGGNGGPPA